MPYNVTPPTRTNLSLTPSEWRQPDPAHPDFTVRRLGTEIVAWTRKDLVTQRVDWTLRTQGLDGRGVAVGIANDAKAARFAADKRARQLGQAVLGWCLPPSLRSPRRWPAPIPPPPRICVRSRPNGGSCRGALTATIPLALSTRGTLFGQQHILPVVSAGACATPPRVG